MKVKLNNSSYTHTFVICAYGECIYLEECIKSIFNQSISSKVIMVTSTNNKYIKDMCKRYNIKLYVRKGKSDIQRDWNFGYNCTDSDLVTLVHQDDIYEEKYLYNVLNYYNRYDDIYFVCTDYYVLKDGIKCSDLNSKLKKVLKFFLRFSIFNKMKFFKVMSLSFGNSICCPSVTYNKKMLGNDNIFTSKLKFSLDWDTFIKIAKMKGRIGYISKKLLCYRIHEDATTMKYVVDKSKRYEEDMYCFLQIWPKWFARIILRFYEKASGTYEKK